MNAKRTTSNMAVCAFLLAITYVISMKSPCNPWSNDVSLVDSSVFKYVALVMSRGGMPYKDAFDHKGPLLYVINYIGNGISYYRGIWLIEFAFLWCTAVCMYKIARLFGNRLYSCFFVTAAFTPITYYFGGGNFTEEYAMPFIAVSIYIFLDYFLHQKVSRLRLIVCGICFGAVLMLRANMVAVWAVFCIVVLIWNVHRNRKIPWNFLLYFLIGSTLVVLPLLLWLLKGGAIGDFIYDYWIFNFKYTSIEERTNIYNKCSSLLVWVCNDLFLISFVSLVYLIRKKKDVFLNVTYLIFEVTTLISIIISGIDYEHYGMVLLPMYVYPLARLSEFMKEKEKSGTSVVVLSMSLLLLIFPNWRSNLDIVINAFRNPNANVTVSDDMETVLDIINENIAEEEKVQVIGNKNIIYVLSKRMAASKYSYQFPIILADDKIRVEFENDMKNNRPAIVIVENYMVDPYMDLFVTEDDYELIYIADNVMGVYKLKEGITGDGNSYQ